MSEVNFIGLGFPRCATSWINKILSAHPEICKPESGLHYFNNNYDKGSEWYKNNFVSIFQPGHKICGEFSSTYSYPKHQDVVLKRIKSEFPNAKLIVSLRCPTQRFKSDYKRALRRGDTSKKSTLDLIRSNPDLLQTGLYANFLKRILGDFDQKNILILHFSDISKDPIGTQKNIFNFLGVNASITFDIEEHQRGGTYNPKSVTFELLLSRLTRFAKFITHFLFLQRLKGKYGKFLLHKMRQLNTRNDSIEVDEKFLNDYYYHDYNETLEICAAHAESQKN